MLGTPFAANLRTSFSGAPTVVIYAYHTERYRVLLQGIDRNQLDIPQCKQLLQSYDEKNWQIGKTKVFMREGLENRLEKDRHARMQKTVQKLQVSRAMLCSK